MVNSILFMTTPLLLLAVIFVSFVSSSSLQAANVLAILPCASTDDQTFSVDNGNIGVISGIFGCVNNNGNGNSLNEQQCVGGDANEIGYNLTADGVPRVVEWANSSLCFGIRSSTSSGTTKLPTATPPSLILAPCSSSSPLFAFSAATKQIQVNAGSSLCVGVYNPPPLLSNVFGNGMVFQSDLPFALFGYTLLTNDIVNVTILNNVSVPIATQQSLPSNGTDNNHWIVNFSPLSKGGPYTVNVISSTNNVTLTDVWIGTLILCSGQSNLSGGNTPVSYIFNASQELAEANNFSNIRIFQVGTYASNGSSVPLEILSYPPRIPWSIATNVSVHDFSATCWLMGKNLALNVLASSTAAPMIGLIESAWGGTSIQPWLSNEAIEYCNTALNLTIPPASYPGGWPIYPSTLYNAMIAPFLGLSFSGFVWYQGESNALNAESWYYNCALPTLFNDWGKKFNNPNAWTGVVQLAPWVSDPSDNQMVSDLRRSEFYSMIGLPNVTIVTAIDTGDYAAPIGSIHPRDKQPVGKRLGAGAAYSLFKQNNLLPSLDVSIAQAMGPTYKSATTGGKMNPASTLSATITFELYDSVSPQLVMLTPQSTGPYANSSTCPSAVTAGDCVGMELQDRNTGTWYPATNMTLSGDKTQLIIETTAAPSNAVLNATANGRGMWPISLIYNAEGVVAFPWEEGI